MGANISERSLYSDIKYKKSQKITLAMTTTDHCTKYFSTFTIYGVANIIYVFIKVEPELGSFKALNCLIWDIACMLYWNSSATILEHSSLFIVRSVQTAQSRFLAQ